MKKKKILIVGAGPGGLALAIMLKRYDIEAKIIEKKSNCSTESKAGTLQPRTLEILDNIGLLDSFLNEGVQVKKTNMYEKDKFVIALNYQKLPAKTNYLLSIPQPKIEQLLVSECNNKKIPIFWNTCFKNYQITEEGKVRVVIEENTKEVTDTYDFVVGADGGKSTLRDLLIQEGKLKLQHQTRYEARFIMADFEDLVHPFHKQERHVMLQKKGMLVFIPMPERVTRVVCLPWFNREVKDVVDRKDFENAYRYVFQNKMQYKKITAISGFYPSKFLTSTMSSGPIFLLGDAAHIMSPIGGQGINMAIEDSYNLAWKFGCLQNTNSNLLNTYSCERLTVARSILSQTDKNHKIFSTTLGNFVMRKMLYLLKNEEENLKLVMKQTLFNTSYRLKIKKENVSFETGDRLENILVKGLKGQSYLFDHLPYSKEICILNFCSNHIGDHQINQLKQIIQSAWHEMLIVSPKGLFKDSQTNCLSLMESCKKLAETKPLIFVRPDKYIKNVMNVEEFLNSYSFNRELLEVEK